MSKVYCTALLIVSTTLLLLGQDAKLVAKGDQFLEMANEALFAEEEELYKKALDFYLKAEMPRGEAYSKIADAMVDKGSYMAASRYYKLSTDPDLGYKRIGDIYIEKGLKSRGYAEKDLYKQAVAYYKKGHDEKGGYRKVAEACYNKGVEGYGNAAAYFKLANDTLGLRKAADGFATAGGKYLEYAAETYALMETSEGYGLAGDRFFDAKMYQKAIESYQEAGDMQRITKFANYVYQQGLVDSANALLASVAEHFEGMGDTVELERMADRAFANRDYATAADYYERIGLQQKTDLAYAYSNLVDLNLDYAIEYARSAGENDLVAQLKRDQYQIGRLYEVDYRFREIKDYEPLEDEEFPDYYQYYIDDIKDDLWLLSSIYNKLISEDVKAVIRVKFNEYKCVKKVLDPTTFQPTMEKAAIPDEDCFL